MGYKEIQLKLPTDYSEEELRRGIQKKFGVSDFSFHILGKSLDARKKNQIHWQMRIALFSKQLKGDFPAQKEALLIPYQKTNKKIIVVGSGPAGFFAAYVLQKAGFVTTILERGAEVTKRNKGILEFEQTGVFNPICNYAFGEGGAGTFSDGKLTSRSKRISQEKQFILENYVRAGAPEEIKYLANAHLGTDNLKIIIKNLRREFQNIGGTIFFETMLDDFIISGNTIKAAVTLTGIMDADIFVVAPGHSSYETYKMMISRGIPFRTKNFAIGTRIEHRQDIINQAQWGTKKLAGVKAAEYRLTSNKEDRLPVFTFCMCPGGIVVPATAYASTNIVNGMSYYNRNGKFANAACVAGIHPDELLGRKTLPLEILDWLKNKEEEFFKFSNSYKAPYCRIEDFLTQKESKYIAESSYPMGLTPAPIWEMLPSKIIRSIKEGLIDFSKKMAQFNSGIMLGFESKTSSPIQVIREANGKVSGFDNLYVVGEGSGYAGGIISSAADGIKAAMHIAKNKY